MENAPQRSATPKRSANEDREPCNIHVWTRNPDGSPGACMDCGISHADA